MRALFSVFLLLISTLAYGQANLVPNPSFEDYNGCPTFASQLDRAAPWFNPNVGTPEYFNTCATAASFISLPAGTTGHFQYPRTGNGFAGFYTFSTEVQNMREYVEVELTEPLENGKCYYLEFFVNAPNDFELASDGIGAYVSQGAITGTNPNIFMVTPQIENPSSNVITDTLGWTKVSGYFTATGGENHITIGNFRDDTSTNLTQINWNVWYVGTSYLYVDDVTLRLHEFDVELGSDTTSCDGETIELKAETDGATSYVWENGSSQPTRNANTEGKYWVEVRLDGCLTSDTIMVITEPQPIIELGNDIRLCNEQEVAIVAKSNIENPTWQNGISDSIFITNKSGVYWAEVSNECGTTSDTVLVKIEDCVCYIYIPNAFTPNGDNTNDEFSIGYDCSFASFDFRIFDRWGNIIFKTSEPDFEWNGGNFPIGNYTYQLRYSSADVFTGKGMRVGSVKIIR